MSSSTGGRLVHSYTDSHSYTFGASNPDDLPPSSGLSKRVAAGIGVGAGLGMLSLSAFGFFLYHRRLRRQKRPQQDAIEEPSNEYRAELQHEHRVELQDDTVAARELETPGKVVCEVDNSASAVEMNALVEGETPAEVDAPAELDTPVKLDVPAEPDLPDPEEGEQLEHTGDTLEE